MLWLFLLVLLAASNAIAQPTGGLSVIGSASQIQIACSEDEILKFSSSAWACAADNAAAGSGAILDLGDDASNESTSIGEIATTGDTNSVFTEPSADKLLINLGNNWPTADAATALSANGANCTAGNAPLGVDASGAVESCFDVEEEAHAAEHAQDAADELLVEDLGTACTANQFARSDGVGGLTCDTALDTQGAEAAASLTLADTTPSVVIGVQYYDCDDTTLYTDFVDADGDYTDFTVDFSFTLQAAAACGIDCSAGNVRCNGGVSWTAAAGDSAFCSFSVTNAGWACALSSPDAINTMSQESATIVAPDTATTDWVRMSGDATASAWGSDGTVMNLDIDNDQAADCTFSKSGGVVTMDCNNTNAIIQPGQTNGDIKFYDSAGTECLELDPDTGVMTQGTNCTSLVFDDIVASYVPYSADTTATVTLSGADCFGYHANNDADAIEFDLCDVTRAGAVVCFEDRAGGQITVDPFGTDVISEADGTAMAAGEAILLASGIGNGFCLISDSATTWHVLPGAVGTLTQESP